MEVNGEADLHLQPMEEPTPEQVDASCGKPVLEQAPGRPCGPVERGAHAGAGLLGSTCDPVGDPHWSRVRV